MIIFEQHEELAIKQQLLNRIAAKYSEQANIVTGSSSHNIENAVSSSSSTSTNNLWGFLNKKVQELNPNIEKSNAIVEREVLQLNYLISSYC